jgi:hypothetical protein
MATATIASRGIAEAATASVKARRAPTAKSVRNPAAEELAATALRCLEMREQAKSLYAAADELESTVLAKLPVGSLIALTDGRRITVRDNFASKNVVFRPSAVRRFEIVTVK